VNSIKKTTSVFKNCKQSQSRCNECDQPFLYDPSNSGDYHPTIYGIVLMGFCPCCGLMKPIVSEPPADDMSHTGQKRTLWHLCNIHNLRYKAVISRFHTNYKYIENKQLFAIAVSKDFDIPVHEVLSTYENVYN